MVAQDHRCRSSFRRSVTPYAGRAPARRDVVFQTPRRLGVSTGFYFKLKEAQPRSGAMGPPPIKLD